MSRTSITSITGITGIGRDRRGLAGLEFAITAPLLVLLLLAVADLTLWMRTWLRTEQASGSLTQVISRYRTLYTSDFTGIFYPLAQAAVGDTALTCGSGGMVVTGIDNSSGTPKVSWQWTSGSCVSSSFTSASGSRTTLSMPGGYTPAPGLSAIVVELFATRAPFILSARLMGTSGLSAIKAYAVAMPRIGSLPPYTAGTRS